MYMIHGFAQVGQVATSFYLREQLISTHINSEHKTRRYQNTNGSVFSGLGRLTGKNNDILNRFSNPRFVEYFLQFSGSGRYLGC